MGRSKKYQDVSKLIDRDTAYQPADAIKMVKQANFAKFDESVEIHFNLGIDPRHADQQIRGTVTLPNGTGSTKRVIAITSADKAKEAEAAGADEVGGEDLIEKISKGWMEFDLVVASPDMMSKVGKLGRVLGTKGLMPNPKAGTVTADIGKAVEEFKKGKVEYRNDKAGIIHLVIGKKSFTEKQLRENFDVIFDVVQKAKPSKSKGIYMKSVSLSTSMGPGLFVEPMKNKWQEELA